MKPDFMDRIEKIIAEVRTRTCIDTEVLEQILQDEILQVELNEYYYEILNEGYEEGYECGLEEAGYTEDDTYYRGFEDGHSKGYDEGYDEGYADGVNGEF